MSIRVRLGTRDDIPALVEVECSDVEEWHRFSPEGRGENKKSFKTSFKQPRP